MVNTLKNLINKEDELKKGKESIIFSLTSNNKRKLYKAQKQEVLGGNHVALRRPHTQNHRIAAMQL